MHSAPLLFSGLILKHLRFFIQINPVSNLFGSTGLFKSYLIVNPKDKSSWDKAFCEKSEMISV